MRKTQICVIALMMFLAVSVFNTAVLPLTRAVAEEPQIEWEKTFGGASTREWADSVIQTNNGGYVLAGCAESSDYSVVDAYVVKTGSDGHLMWRKTYGKSQVREWARSIVSARDGGYVFAGSTGSYPAYDIYMVKIGSNGNTLWEKTFDRSGSNDQGNCIQQTSDGGYVIAGDTGSKGYLIKTDAAGKLLWSKTFGASSRSSGFNSVQQTTDGGYILAGSSSDQVTEWVSGYLVKTNAYGKLQWARLFGLTSRDCGFSEVQQTGDGGYILAGYSEGHAYADCDAYVIKTDKSGNKQWTSGFFLEGFEEASSIIQTKDGGYIFGGVSYEVAYLVKIDSSGNQEWQKIWSDMGFVSCIRRTRDGGYIVAGSKTILSEDAYLCKLSYNLDDGFESGSFSAWSATRTSSGETARVVSTLKHHGTYSAKFTSNGGGGYERAYCSKTLPPSTELYARGYFYVSKSGIAEESDRFFFTILRAGSTDMAYAGWKQTGDTVKWCLTMRDGTTNIDIFSSSSPLLNRWYCVELHWKKDAASGVAEVWVDGAQVCSGTGKNTAAFGNVNSIRCGLADMYGCASTTVYCDCAKTATTHIGPET